MEQKQQKKTFTLGRIFSALICTVLILIISINVAMIVKSYTDPDNIPSVFGISPVVVLSGSMEPEFGADSLIFIKDVKTDTLQNGDIITFLHGEVAVTHRIDEVVIEDGKPTYITKGDANNTADSMPVSPEQIQGVYTGHVDKLGGILMFMQSSTGLLLFVALPLLVYFLVDLLFQHKENKAGHERANALQAELETLRQKQEVKI